MVKQEVVTIIDNSESIYGKECNTINGINLMLDEIKLLKSYEDTVLISIKLFNNKQLMKLRHMDIKYVKKLVLSDFLPNGCSALFDAIGDTLKYFMEKKLYNPTAYDNCIIYIVANGLENSSKKYNKITIKKMIKTAEIIYNIDIIYIGSNKNAILEANSIGIKSEQIIYYSETEKNIKDIYRSCAEISSNSRKYYKLNNFNRLENKTCFRTYSYEAHPYSNQ